MTNDMQAYLKIDCLWEVAIRNNNPAACEAMGSQKISRMFIGEISQQTCLAAAGERPGCRGEHTMTSSTGHTACGKPAGSDRDAYGQE